MRKLILVTVLSLFASTGCFLRAGIAPGVYGTVTPVGAAVASTGGVVASTGGVVTSGVSSSVTVNGQPATATATVNPNGSVGVAVGAPGASMSASASVVAH